MLGINRDRPEAISTVTAVCAAREDLLPAVHQGGFLAPAALV